MQAGLPRIGMLFSLSSLSSSEAAIEKLSANTRQGRGLSTLNTLRKLGKRGRRARRPGCGNVELKLVQFDLLIEVPFALRGPSRVGSMAKLESKVALRQW